MPTAACGINCDICGLHVRGVCSSCGPGTSREAAAKLAIQQQLFGQPCPILACAHLNHLEYCMRDCPSFPCENFETREYPFSKGFLSMQQRRLAASRNQSSLPGAGRRIAVPPDHWESLQQRDPAEVCRTALAQLTPSGEIRLRVLNTDFLVHPGRRIVWAVVGDRMTIVSDPFLQLLTVVYLQNVTTAPLRHEKIGVPDLKSAHFFQGPHDLDLGPLLDRYGRDAEGFRKAAVKIGGRPVSGAADGEVVFSPFPKILLYYLLWEGDAEFAPRISVLFDRSIEDHFAADFIWGLISCVNTLLLCPSLPFVPDDPAAD